MSGSSSQRTLLRDALSATTAKDKGPPIVDGILSITHDPPEVVDWRRSAVDLTEATSSYLDDDDDGERGNSALGHLAWHIDLKRSIMIQHARQLQLLRAPMTCSASLRGRLRTSPRSASASSAALSSMWEVLNGEA
eukprot:322561-Chlamydomonas_euryale.AAC.7